MNPGGGFNNTPLSPTWQATVDNPKKNMIMNAMDDLESHGCLF